MRLLGVGGSSVVFALPDNDDEAAGEEKREESITEAAVVIASLAEELIARERNVSHRLRSRFALRLSKQITFVCLTCEQALARYVGFRHEISLTEELVKRCAAAASPSLRQHCEGAGHANLIPNFAINPVLLMEGRRGSQWLAVEIKPKGVWRSPRVVGIVVDGVKYYINPVKLQQCRFSLMQVFKREQRRVGMALPGERDSVYCPNMLLLGDQTSVAAGLRQLIRCPANNFRFIPVENPLGEIGDAELEDLSTALHESDVFRVLANLQLYGSASHSDWEVLDIELLYQWSCARDMSSVRWIVRESEASAFLNVECACQRGIHAVTMDEGQTEDITTIHLLSPPMGLRECIDRFYVSTTANDVSVVVSLSKGNVAAAAGPTTAVDGPTGSRRSLELTQWRSLYGGVFVDFGFPTASILRIGVVDIDAKLHKSLQHYFEFNKDILAAWERWKSVWRPPLRSAAA
ncbi:inositol-pentakisphosphate 2-kinase [Trypanosoma rangeli]|uniref:Inositol-pentakisphosphate 2-kinase n=1 Tax=Trypanosoma rangeli TaxID=5698 RepID=A0A3R7K0N1_TRYRA|nr:inositol-pentakisphosphate 2-kinase [Trypanosoma rangeli]RNE99785.1 inositol-pentakisphosphate 2-kinase [Trypanosoma rangeli]|eukprot:RNE99785.1 inositol-pentakisphosphate 2-kinase [Trypanosoma rangeli]